MSILTIILFFLYAWGLGFTATFFLKIDNFFERNIIRLGIGLASIPVVISLLGLLRIPIDWRIILFLSLVVPLFFLIKKGISLPKIKLTKSTLYFLIVFILFGFTLFMYTRGAFLYPYLEDDDPWGYALSAKYIATEKTIYEPSTTSHLFSYLDARPPGYSGLLAILHQTSPSLQWTMKFFNALIISLGILLFYVFASKILKNKGMAVFATFVLAMTPSYLSHFIWSHALAITLFLPAMICILYIVEDKRWGLPSMITIAAILLTQETQSAKFAIILIIFFAVFSIVRKKINWNIAIASTSGLALASVLWWIPMIIRYGGIKGLWNVGMQQGVAKNASALLVHPSLNNFYFGEIGSVLRQRGVFTLKDFLFPSAQNMINVPIGTGWVIILLIVIGIIYLISKTGFKENPHYLLILLLTLFAFLGVNGGVHWWSPIALYPFRFWLLFAMFGSLVAAYGLWVILSTLKGKTSKLIFFGIIIIGIIFTSGIPKYKVNTAIWPPGGSWSSQIELQGYIWTKENLDVNTRIFDINSEMFSTGMDMYSCYWCLDEKEYRATLANKTSKEMRDWIKKRNYDYVIVGLKYFKKYGMNLTLDSNYFSPVVQNQDFYLFRVIT